ncbi:MAG: LysE family transporter [Marinilabiliaceae bacterium]|nr:LysE family transporter [Marinilabiliaceae bacterium]
MSLSFILSAVIIGLLASIPLGPIGVLCVQRTLNKGRLSGFISGLGAAMSDTIYAIIAGFSLSFIIGFIETQILWIQIIGAIILIGMGLRIFYTNPAVQLRKQKKRNRSLAQDFFSTFLLTISNPLAVFLLMALFTAFRVVQTDSTGLKQVVLVVGIFAGASLWWFTLSGLVNLFRSKINLRRLFWINKIAGSSIVVLVIIAFVSWLITEYLMVA